MVPQAWEKYPDLDPAIKAFYEYHQCVLEPWDGPAAIAFTDGVIAAAAVDRNGLRPCRYKVRRDGLVVASSEVGRGGSGSARGGRVRQGGPGRGPGGGHRARRGDSQPRRQAGDRGAAAVRALGGPLHGDPRAGSRAGARGTGRRRSDPARACVRLRGRGPPAGARADGLHRRRSGLEHGRRHTDPAALGGAAERLRVFPAAVRPGDQPADRSPAGEHGDVAAHAPRAAGVAAAGTALVRAHAPAGASDPAGRRDGRAPQRGGVLHRDARCGVGCGQGRGRIAPGADRASTRRGARRAAWRAGDHHQRSHGRCDPCADSDAPGGRRGAAASGAHRTPRPGRTRRRGGRCPRHPSLRDADRLRRRGGAPLARARGSA